ncbi:hypothetical protein [Micromonospora sp. IBHARD004]
MDFLEELAERPPEQHLDRGARRRG